jgi:RNA polymerase sigma-70 factor (ECF subfamily)
VTEAAATSSRPRLQLRWPAWPKRRPALVRSQYDPEAFVEVHDEFAPALTGDTLATVYEKRGDFRGTTSAEAEAWIWTIARNNVKHFWRRREVDRGAMVRIGMARQLATDEDLERIDELLTGEAASGALDAALGELPADQRDVILLRYVDELSDQDIAAKLDVSPEVVRARSSRGLRRLRGDPRLEPLVDDDGPPS